MSPAIFAPVLASVFVASLAGGMHCVGMCGPLMFATEIHRRGAWQLLYHAARGTAYVTLGVVAGWIGEGFDASARMVGLGTGASLVCGLLLITIGAVSLLPVGRTSFTFKPFVLLRKAGLTAALRLSGHWRATAMGLSCALMPCGWLYAHLLIAAGTGQPLRGGAVMLSFFLGTVPWLAFASGLLRRAVRLLGIRAQAVVSIVMIVAGFFLVAQRLPMVGWFPFTAEGKSMETQAATCH